MEKSNVPTGSCLNCAQPLPSEASFCPACGQKNTDGKTSVFELISVFFGAVFNYDSRLFKTIRHLFIPGRLTTAFFQGKHKSYVHPVQLFVLSSLFFIATVGLTSKQWNTEQLNFLNERLQTIQNRNQLIKEIDSLKYLPAIRDKASIDSLIKLIPNEENSDLQDSISLSSVLNISGEKLPNMAYEDLYKLSNEELIEKYSIDNWWLQLIFIQVLKIVKNSQQFVNFIIGQTTFLALIMMPLFAFVLKLFYIRRKRYYVEHVVFSFHIHIFMFLISGTSILFFLYYKAFPIWLFFPLIPIYVFFALKRYYGQSYFKSMLKYVMLGFFYLVILSLATVFTLLMSVFLF